jgi:hypothetical protein
LGTFLFCNKKFCTNRIICSKLINFYNEVSGPVNKNGPAALLVYAYKKDIAVH